MPTTFDLGRAAKQKFPGQYDDVDEQTLGKAMQQKFPGAYDDFVDAPGPPKAPIPAGLSQQFSSQYGLTNAQRADVRSRDTRGLEELGAPFAVAGPVGAGVRAGATGAPVMPAVMQGAKNLAMGVAGGTAGSYVGARGAKLVGLPPTAGAIVGGIAGAQVGSSLGRAGGSVGSYLDQETGTPGFGRFLKYARGQARAAAGTSGPQGPPTAPAGAAPEGVPATPPPAMPPTLRPPVGPTGGAPPESLELTQPPPAPTPIATSAQRMANAAARSGQTGQQRLPLSPALSTPPQNLGIPQSPVRYGPQPAPPPEPQPRVGISRQALGTPAATVPPPQPVGPPRQVRVMPQVQPQAQAAAAGAESGPGAVPGSGPRPGVGGSASTPAPTSAATTTPAPASPTPTQTTVPTSGINVEVPEGASAAERASLQAEAKRVNVTQASRVAKAKTTATYLNSTPDEPIPAVDDHAGWNALFKKLGYAKSPDPSNTIGMVMERVNPRPVPTPTATPPPPSTPNPNQASGVVMPSAGQTGTTEAPSTGLASKPGATAIAADLRDQMLRSGSITPEQAVTSTGQPATRPQISLRQQGRPIPQPQSPSPSARTPVDNPDDPDFRQRYGQDESPEMKKFLGYGTPTPAPASVAPMSVTKAIQSLESGPGNYVDIPALRQVLGPNADQQILQAARNEGLVLAESGSANRTTDPDLLNGGNGRYYVGVARARR